MSDAWTSTPGRHLCWKIVLVRLSHRTSPAARPKLEDSSIATAFPSSTNNLHLFSIVADTGLGIRILHCLTTTVSWLSTLACRMFRIMWLAFATRSMRMHSMAFLLSSSIPKISAVPAGPRK